MSTRNIKVEDLRSFVFVSDPQMSPDGNLAAFVHTTVDYKNDDYVKHIWLHDVKTGKNNQFTHGTGKDSYPRWSPDGEKLLFLSSGREESEGNKLYVIPTGGGEAQLVVDMETGVTNPVWGPGSKRVLFTSRVWEPKKPESDVVVVRRIKFKLNGVGIFAGKRIHLFSVRIGRKPKQLTKGEYDVENAAWSPDGKQIALVTNQEEDQDTSFVRDIFLIPSKGGEMKKITNGKLGIDGLRWSQDGETIAFLGDDFHARGATNTDLWTMPANGGEPVNLTKDFDRSLGRGIGSDLRVGTPYPGIVWGPDDEHLYFQTGSIPTANIYRVNRETKNLEQLTKGITVDGFSYSKDFTVLVYNAMNATSLCELWIKDDMGTRQATDFNGRLLKKLSLSIPEHFMFKNEEGTKVDGWVMKPPGFKESAKYPTIVQIHGGPLGVYGDGIYHEFQLLNAAGYCVIYTNPRGSGGYGEEYGAVLQGHHGETDYRDMMTFLDSAIDQFSYIDSTRLGVTGGSYGGYLTNWIITQTERFKAAVTCRSTCNRLSHHGYSDFGFHHGESGNMGYPWKDEEKLLRQSPLRYAANIKTPTLLIHSENDLRCTMQQAEEFFVALKEVGVDAELIRFPDENHELSRSGKPKHREERLIHILRWFNKYLKE